MNKLKEYIKKYDKFYIFSWILLICFFVFLCIFFEKKITGQLDADASSEMVLSKLLADNGNLVLSPLWNYSTELRVFNVQIVWGLLFRFLSNWHVVRVTGTIIWWLLLLVSLFGLCKELKLKRFYPLIALCFLLPLSFQYYEYVITKLWYMTHIIVTINLLTLSFKYLNTDNNKTRTILLIIGFIVSFITGLGGARHIMVFSIPYIIAMLAYLLNERINKKKLIFKDYYYCILNFIGICLGYLINSKVLHNIYKFDAIEGSLSLNYDLNRVTGTLKNLLNVNGYVGISQSSIINTIQNICAVLLIIICILCIVITFKKRNTINRTTMIMNSFFIFGMLCLIIIQIFSSVDNAARYLLPIYPFSIIVLFNIANSENRLLFRKILISSFLCLYIVSGLLTLNSNRNASKNYLKQDVVKYLLDNDYYNGYSFFWDANDVTELSNGEIEMWSWGFVSSTPEDFKDIYYNSPWLQKKEHVNSFPKGKIFILLTKEANDKFKDLTYYFTDKQRIYQNEEYVVYGFSSFDELKTIMHL